MTIPNSISHRLVRQLTDGRKNNELTYLRRDGKTQVTVEYNETGKPVRIDTIVISTQHAEAVTTEQIEKDIIKYVVEPIVPEKLHDKDTKYLINPTGRFVIGGRQGDVALSGGTNIVDTYGGYSRHVIGGPQ